MRARLLMSALSVGLIWFIRRSIKRKSSVQTNAELCGGIPIWIRSTGKRITRQPANSAERSSGAMATTTGVSAHVSVPMSTDGKAASEPLFSESLMRFCLVMAFADKLLERNILSVEEYADFSVKTAQSFSLKMPQNPCNSTR